MLTRHVFEGYSLIKIIQYAFFSFANMFKEVFEKISMACQDAHMLIYLSYLNEHNPLKAGIGKSVSCCVTGNKITFKLF